MTVSESKARSQPQMHTDAPSSLMWTAPEGASDIYSAGARSVAAPTSEVSPVHSPVAAGPPGALRHNRATPARHRVLPPSRYLRGRRAGCPATPETGPEL